MASNTGHPTVQMPPLDNWAAQTFAYGFMLDRSASLDYSGNASPNQSGNTGFTKPEPDDLHLLNLNPQSLSMDEPIATSVVPSQGGGKFIESRGGVMKSISIRGTTGFMPPIAPYAQHMKTPEQLLRETNPANLSEFELAQVLARQSNQTGFFEFYRLRRLFRQFMIERRQGRAVQMHWLDFKGDEFWMIEPKRFHLERGRFSYTYDISFDCIEPSTLRVRADDQGFDARARDTNSIDRGALALQSLLRNPLHGAMDANMRSRLGRAAEMVSSAKQFVQNFSIGVLTLKFQSVMNNVNNIQEFFADIAAIRRAVLDVPATLFKQLYSSITGLADSFEDITPSAFRADVNEWLVEMKGITEFLVATHQATYGSTPGRAFADEHSKFTQPLALDGIKGSFMEESRNPNAVTKVGTGLAAIGNIERMVSTTAMRAEDVLTNETIFDVAQRIMGDAQRFIDLVVINKLQPPFIVADTNNKPAGTIAWGEKILVPAREEPGLPSLSLAAPVSVTVPAISGVATANSADVYMTAPVAAFREDLFQGFTIEITSGPNAGAKRVCVSSEVIISDLVLTPNRAFDFAITIGTTFKVYLELFNPRPAATPDTRAFGKDVMGVFTRVGGVAIDGTIDVMIGPRKDLSTVQGMENFHQAITLALQTPRGANRSNPLYGTASVIGRPFEPNILALNLFYVRQSLLQDPRVSSVERPEIRFENGEMYFTVYVRPVRVQRTMFFRIPL